MSSSMPNAHNKPTKQSKFARTTLDDKVRLVLPRIPLQSIANMVPSLTTLENVKVHHTASNEDGSVRIEDGVLLGGTIQDLLQQMMNRLDLVEETNRDLQSRVANLETTLHGKVGGRVGKVKSLQKESKRLLRRVQEEHLRRELETNAKQQKTEIEQLEQDVFFSQES